MNDNSTYYHDLITRYFSGEIREDELRLLSDWMKADPEHEELFKEYRKTWELIEKQKISSAVNTDEEWISMQALMDSVSAKDEIPVKVIKLTETRKNLRFSMQSIRKVAAAVTVLLVSSFLLYYYFNKPSNIVVAAQSANIEQVLPDGSVVTLHAGSQLTYPETFEGKTRQVELTGEAYFVVAHDKNKPFIVSSGDARIEVLGTQFNVNTQATSKTMEVVLTTGKVSVYYNQHPQENVLLAPGEKAEILTGQKQIRKSAAVNPNYMAWKTRILVFDNTTIAEAVKIIQNVYLTPVKLSDQRLSGCRITATFNGQSLESVLEVFRETLNLQIIRNGDTIEISGNGCNP